MPRLFTGLEIPQSQRTQLSLLQTGLKNVRWIEPENFHVTLKFIGDVTPRTADEIVDALGSRSWAAPEIRLGELGTFGKEKSRTVYASVAEDPVLSALAQSQERLMQMCGLDPEGRKFIPHVTLCRTRSGTGNEAVARYLSIHGGFSAPPFRPARFVLYSAKESTGGGPYRVEQGWEFEPQPS